MKKIILLSLNLSIGCMLMAQTIVSTTPRNRNIVAEIYSGVNEPVGSFFTAGAAGPTGFQQSWPESCLIVIHAIQAAPPSYEPSALDFRTTFGDGLRDYFDVYPNSACHSSNRIITPVGLLSNAAPAYANNITVGIFDTGTAASYAKSLLM